MAKFLRNHYFSRAAVLCGIAATVQTMAASPIEQTQPLAGGESADEIIRMAANVVPSPRQLAYHQLDFTCFIHFGINTYTGKEWGSGTENPQLFNPGETLDTDQWCRAAKAAGMRLILITVKHHDGFCLWQTRYNDKFSVRATSWRNGKGDVLRELADSCRKHGLKLGVYLSPADLYQMESADGYYGNGSKPVPSAIPTDPAGFRSDPAKVREGLPVGAPVVRLEADDYNRYFMNQLYELLTEYGPIHEVWFDGAHPKQKGGQTYLKTAWFAMIRQLAPDAVIFGGPDVRWCGNEAGRTRDTEWNVLPATSLELTGLDRPQQDLASDNMLVQPEYEVYGKKYPVKMLQYLAPEINTSIRNGWFWRNEHEQEVRTADDVFDIYERAVGGNGVFLLNVPPDNTGRFGARDVACLEETGRRIRATYDKPLVMRGASASAPALLDDDLNTYVQGDGVHTELELRLAAPSRVNRVVLQEAVAVVGQRVASHAVDAWVDGGWKEVAAATTIGYRRILRFAPVETDRLRLRVTNSRAAPALATFTVAYYDAPLPRPLVWRAEDGMVQIMPPGAQKAGKIDSSGGEGIVGLAFHYTLDGTEPGIGSTRYDKPFALPDGGVVKAVAVVGGQAGPVAIQRIGYPQHGWKVVECSGAESAEYGPERAIDGKPASHWHTSWSKPSPHPHTLTVDMGKVCKIAGFTYLPRQDKAVPDAMVEKGTMEFSEDGRKWGAAQPFHFGNLVNDPSLRTQLLARPTSARYFRFTSKAGAAGKPYAGAAEIGMLPE